MVQKVLFWSGGRPNLTLHNFILISLQSFTLSLKTVNIAINNILWCVILISKIAILRLSVYEFQVLVFYSVVSNFGIYVRRGV